MDSYLKRRLVLLIAIGLVVLWYTQYQNRDLSDSKISIGRTALVKGHGAVLSATSRANHESMIKACNAYDMIGLEQLKQAGRVLLVPVGTRVRVIDKSSRLVQVRIEDGPYRGSAVWMFDEDLSAPIP